MTTRLFGLLGWPVGHSVSPAMMNAAFDALGIDAVYLPFAVTQEQFATAVDGLTALGAVGVNVTIPHKVSAYIHVHEKSPAADLAKAVNTLKFNSKTNVISGHNTDVGGWWHAVSAYATPDVQDVTLLGAGGAARAVVAALALYAPRLRVKVVARNLSKVQELVSEFGNHLAISTGDWDHRSDAIANAQWVIQSTPVGMAPNIHESPVDDDGCFQAGQFVQDLVYRPSPTRFLQMAAGRGCRVQDGLDMLVGQGAEAFEWWTGQSAPIEAMRTAAELALRH